MTSNDSEVLAIGNYFLFASELNIRPWELDKMDTVLVQGLRHLLIAKLAREQEEFKNLLR